MTYTDEGKGRGRLITATALMSGSGRPYARWFPKKLHGLKRKKAELTQGLPLLHKESVELSIQQFGAAARASVRAS